MADVEALVSDIELKVGKMIERLQSLQNEHVQLEKEIHEQNQINHRQKHTIEELEQKINLLKTTRNLEIKEGSIDAKVTVNELLREIDRCIGLLNR